jgi:hypothetical protein
VVLLLELYWAFYMHLIKEAKPEAKSSKRETNMLMMRNIKQR